MKKDFSYLHKGPLELWHNGLMVGNGTLGALIYGKEEIVFSLDRIDLWDNRKPPELSDPNFTYEHMLWAMENDWEEYNRLFDDSYSHPYPTKLNAGSLIIERPIGKKDILSLDAERGDYRLALSDVSIEGYLDANQNVLVIRSDAQSKMRIHMPEYLSREEKGLGYPAVKEFEEGSFRWTVQKTKTSLVYGIVILQAGNDSFVTVYKASKANYLKEIENAKKMLLAYKDNQKENREKHLSYWKRYYRTSNIKIPDLKMRRLYNLGRYFFACNSKGKFPMALEGVWTRNDGNLPPWKGDYHNDINLQMSYESYLKTGNFKEGRVLVDYLWRIRGVFERFAHDFANSEGYLIPGVMSQAGDALGGWPMYALNPADAIWLSKAFDDYYRFTGDERFLKARAYPFLSSIEKCIRNLLVENERGHLRFGYSASPEYGDNKPESILAHQSNFELGMLHYLYRVLDEYAEKLSIENPYKTIRERLADYARNEKGELMISKDLEYGESHRHFSHLLAEKNMENLTPYSNREQIKKDFDRLESFGSGEWAGFSFTEASQFASYLSLGEKAYYYAFAFADAFVNENGFHMNMDLNHKGYSTIQSYAFTLEANIGYIRAIADQMMICPDGIITLFPGIPEKWKEEGVSFRNLRAHGNIRVSGSYKHGKMASHIKSKNGGIRLYNNIGERFPVLVNGKRRLIEAKIGQVIDFCGATDVRLEVEK